MCCSNKGVTRKHLWINFWGETLGKQAFLVADVEMEGLDREVTFLLLYALSIVFNALFPHETIGPGMETPPPGRMFCYFAR
jgi:hypothetical protein